MIVKSVGRNGQITLGKAFAGRLVMIDQAAPGVWTLKMGEFVPESESWLHRPEAKAKLDRALQWAQQNAPRESRLDELAAKIAAPARHRRSKAGSRSR
jgi:hypothetical protein